MCMLDEIRAKRDEIYAIARRHKAEKLWVFGSCARKEERPDSDVDFLVKECDIERVDKLLTADGYVARKKEHSHHITYTKNGIRAEMHFLPPGIPEGKTGERIKGYFENITDEARDAKTSVGSICVPSDFHHGMLLLLHTIHHLTGDGLGLRHLCDWAVFVSSFKEAEFIALFEEKLKSVGMWEFAKILTKASGMFLGAPCVLSENDADEDICSALPASRMASACPALAAMEK